MSRKLKDRLIRLGSQRPDLRDHLRPLIDELVKNDRVARRHRFEEGDRVRVLQGPMEGLAVTVYEIRGNKAMVSPTSHGRKTEVNVDDLAPIQSSGAKPDWPEGVGVPSRKRR